MRFISTLVGLCCVIFCASGHSTALVQAPRVHDGQEAIQADIEIDPRPVIKNSATYRKAKGRKVRNVVVEKDPEEELTTRICGGIHGRCQIPKPNTAATEEEELTTRICGGIHGRCQIPKPGTTTRGERAPEGIQMPLPYAAGEKHSRKKVRHLRSKAH
eukprot:Gregarina_sp_Poly_1__2534@NODE_1689_length_3531_cov_474_954965_g1110_i0_p2_GENE_NODE_1689_length_3531_cov_474_954965_g1110_i0NODE_1689_length_3531_cov_474_954965_g1110_i0_p2_ORF_typecomplete_len159_score14_52_NODE_1689_length_3531_cov_474_954965_g1110_i023052781